MGITIKRPNAKPGRHEESMSQRNIDLNKVHLHANLLALFFCVARGKTDMFLRL